MDFERDREVVAQARLIILIVNAFLYFIECLCITHISWMVKTKAVYIFKTFEQIINPRPGRGEGVDATTIYGVFIVLDDLYQKLLPKNCW